VDAMDRIENCGVVPVVVLDKTEQARKTAKALLNGGVDVMEVTLRTDAGLSSIAEIASSCPEILVGAGTVLTLEQCKECVDAGARFIVSPGFDEQIVRWCLNNGIPMLPGCVTPTEITRALSFGLHVLKFFPANVYGGLSAMKALAAPFGNVRFIPTGGVNAANLSEYSAAPFIYAVGGSWICDKQDIAAGDYEKISRLCREARGLTLGYEFAHVGVNTQGEDESVKVCQYFSDVFGFPVKTGGGSNFSSGGVEVMKTMYLGTHGHIGVRTNSVKRAMADLKKRGFELNMDSVKYKGDRITAVYLKDEAAGFAVHIVQK